MLDVPKKYTDFVRSSNKNLALMNGLSFSKRSSIVNLNTDTLFVDNDALRVEEFE